MTKIEAIFGGVLLLALMAAASFMLIQKGLPDLGSTFQRTAVVEELSPAVFSGDYKQDMCTCYETGYAEGASFIRNGGSQEASIDDTPQFKTGYSACRAAAGLEGGSAWSAGWGNGQGRIRSQRSCAFYLKTQNIR